MALPKSIIRTFLMKRPSRLSVSFKSRRPRKVSFAERDRREIERAAEGLSLLTLNEIDILAALICLECADTRATRSWRGRVLSACAALRRIEPSLLPAATQLARARRRKIDAVFTDGEDRWLVSPFTAAPRGSEAE